MPITWKNMDCVFWEVVFFSSLNFGRRLCNSVVGKQPIAVLPASKLSQWLSGNCQGHTLPEMKLNGIELLSVQIVIFWSRHNGVRTYDQAGLYHSACMGYCRSLMLYSRAFMDLSYVYRYVYVYNLILEILSKLNLWSLGDMRPQPGGPPSLSPMSRS